VVGAALKARARLFLAALVAAAALGAAALTRPGRTQWDLRVYMECARALAAGKNPYAIQPIVDSSRFQCLYPPAIIDLYRPFAEFPGGERAWAALKVLSLALMLWLWRAYILPRGSDVWRLAVIAAAYGSPFWSDFRSGNAGSFEHLLLWAGLAAFIAGKDLWFAGFIAAAAQPKLLPAAFLPLLILKPKPRWSPAIWGGVAALAVFGINELLHPGLLRQFFLQLGDPMQPWHYERGPNNVAFVGLMEHIFETATGIRPTSCDSAMRVNIVWSAAVVSATGWGLSRLWRGPGTEEEKRRACVLLFAAAYALVAPRLKDYSFLLLLPPTLAVLESDAPRGLRLAILVFALLNSTKGVAEKAGLGPWALFAGYFKLYAAALVWAAMIFTRGLSTLRVEISSAKR
jgi:hypothetical protein